MYKNTTFLTKQHNLQSNTLKMLSRHVMPLFEITIFDLKPFIYPQNRRARLFRKGVWEKSKQMQNFSKLLCLHANIDSNCRRDKLINSKRNCLLQFFNTKVNKQLYFQIILGKANHYVPDEQLVNQIKLVLQNSDQKIIYQTSSKKHKSKFHGDSSKLTIKQVLQNVQIQKWSSYINYQFANKSVRNFRLLQLENSYLQVSISNYYKIKFSKNSVVLYEDMRDFDKMLSKFNFIRFFTTSGVNNALRSQKNCECLIKKLRWRTNETQQYLLLLIRNNSWQRFCITVQNFVYLYESQFKRLEMNIQQRVKQSK